MGLRLKCAAIAAIAAIAVAGCGSGGSTDGAGTTAGTSASEAATQIKVGVIPVSTIAPIYLGQEKGFFAKQGLHVTPHFAQGGAALVPAVVSGDQQAAFSNVISLLLAAQKGLPIQIIASASGESTKAAKAQSALAVKKDSGIRSAKDLEGKTIGVNTIDNIAEITARRSLEKRGVDTGTIKWAEIDFPDMLAALDSDRIDAAFLVEPWTTEAKAKGTYRILTRPYYDTRPGLTTTAYFVSKKYASENPEVVAKLARSLQRSVSYAATHEAATRAMVPKFTKIPPDIVGKISFGSFPTQGVDVSSLRLLASLMQRYGLIDHKPDIDALVWHG